MKKLFVMICGMTMSAAVMASTGSGPGDKKDRDHEMKNLKEDVRAHKETKDVVNHDLHRVRIARAIHDHKAVARTNRMMKDDSKKLKADGVDHPITTARHEVKMEDQRHS